MLSLNAMVFDLGEMDSVMNFLLEKHGFNAVINVFKVLNEIDLVKLEN